MKRIIAALVLLALLLAPQVKLWRGLSALDRRLDTLEVQVQQAGEKMQGLKLIIWEVGK